MKKINIKFMKDEVLQTIKNNPEKYTQKLIDNPDSNQWLIDEFKDPFVVKKLVISDFVLVTENNISNKELAHINALILHDALKNLPAYVLSDEAFWAWINFDKAYNLCQILMPLKVNSSRLKNHYFYSGNSRRGMFFGVISRLFFRAHITYDANNANPYELTQYVNENPQRFRNLTWRNYSNNFELVKRILKIQYKLELLYKEKINTKTYEAIAKYMSQIGSTTYIDIISENDLEKMIIAKFMSSEELT